jgi:predicted GNAT family acetyltransferase
MAEVFDNPTAHRFELEEQGLVAFADYRLRGEVLVIPHVEAPAELRGTGAAGRLMEGVLGIVRERGQRVAPLCSYAAAYIRRHQEWQDLVD